MSIEGDVNGLAQQVADLRRQVEALSAQLETPAGINVLAGNDGGGARTRIYSNGDLNTAMTTGFYNGSGMLNTPDGAGASANWWFVQVERHHNMSSIGS